MVQFSHEEARVTSLEMDLPAVHRVLVKVSVLHNISGSVDLLPRRDVMVSVNSDCFSGSAASSGKKKAHFKIDPTQNNNLQHYCVSYVDQ